MGLVPLFNDMESSEFPRWNAIVLVFPLPWQNYRMGSFCIFVGFSLFWREHSLLTQRPRNSRNSVLQNATSFWITINHTIPTTQTWIQGPTKHFLSEITKLQNHEIKIKHIPEKFSQNHEITKSRNQDPFNFIPTNPFQFSHHI